ncbi:MAG: hypothetical protein K6U74_07295 [Firmicutes bacterium]|nr:hypothetical protein [Bacillota bacterium]
MAGSAVRPVAEDQGRRHERTLLRVAKSNAGYGFVLALVFLPVALGVFSLVMDIGRFYAMKVGARHAVNLALRSASAQIDLNLLRDPLNPQVRILPAEAETVFRQFLRENLRLDGNYYPLPGSPADGQVRVEYFQVVNNVPYTYQFAYEGGVYQETVTEPSVTAIVSFPVKVWWMRAVKPGTRGMVNMYVHSTVAPRVVAPRAVGYSYNRIGGGRTSDEAA